MRSCPASWTHQWPSAATWQCHRRRPRRLRAKRSRQVPLGQQQGTGWDTAYAALYLNSDEARFVTGVILPVDGGQIARIG
ncbi:MAG: SDR family oxidoreductase [Acidimicrobiales bacterium]